MTPAPLKLLAADGQDLQVIAAVLQDAIVPAIEMAFKADEQRFLAVVHRFRWDCVCEQALEDQDRPSRYEAADCYERINCALDIQGVTGVQTSGFDHKNPSVMLDLLTLSLEEGLLTLIFAGGAQIRLKVENWRLRMQDFGESWPTKHKPSHPT